MVLGEIEELSGEGVDNGVDFEDCGGDTVGYKSCGRCANAETAREKRR